MFSDDIKFSQKAIIRHPVNNTFLVLQRSMSSKTHPLFWDFAGGNVLYGEDALCSIKNEIEEETGLQLSGEIKPILFNAKMKEEQGFYRIFVGYFCQSETDNVVISVEHTDFKWVSKAEFKSLETVDIIKEMIKKI